MARHFVILWLCGIILAVFFVLQQLLGMDLAWEVGSVHINFFLSLIAHADMGHLLGNLFALGLFGLILEGRVGSKNVLWVFLITGIIANFAGIGTYNRILGASGAIYGIMGVLVVLRPWMIIWVSALPMPMLLAGVVWVFVSFVGMFAPTNTGHLAHLVGLVAGVGIGFYWRGKYGDKRRKRNNKQDAIIDAQLDAWEKHTQR